MESARHTALHGSLSFQVDTFLSAPIADPDSATPCVLSNMNTVTLK